MLFTLVQEIREMKVQLGLLATDSTVKQELGVGGRITQGPCRLCHGHAHTGRVQNNDAEPTCSDYHESQLP